MKRLLLPLLAALALPTAVEADSLRDNYYKQENRKQEELRNCRWLIANSQHDPKRSSLRYIFDLKNNTVQFFEPWANQCINYREIELGKIYKDLGKTTTWQYLIEYSGKRGTLVRNVQYAGNVSRKELCECIIRSSSY